MALDPGYGETPVPGDELDAFLPDLRAQSTSSIPNIAIKLGVHGRVEYRSGA
ncbi:hypothetical protein ADILRU_2014 [Leifsonia rubra CMS 76R]|nr:hypothetical protein ADILRU_2014 [Leifsonia rubra CMS 76R]